MTTQSDATQTIIAWLQTAGISPTLGAEPAEIKKIVDGKTYNTKTATHLALYAYDDCDQYEWYWEHLYQTRNGAFFLVGDGMSEYTPYGALLPGTNDYIRGHVLLPLNVNQVRKWLEMRELVEEYEEIFGEQDDASADESTSINQSHTMTLRLPLLLAQRVKALCTDKESFQSFVQSAVELACENRARK